MTQLEGKGRRGDVFDDDGLMMEDNTPVGTAIEKNKLNNNSSSKGGKKRANKPQPRIRDDVFWTELEIRRLSNLVAEAIHSRRYIGDSLSATEERQQMRVYIDAMKRKAMRVLHRAESFAQGVGAAWPGIDRSIADPVSLADEYVRLVETYLAVVNAEEERVRQEKVAAAEEEAAAAAVEANNMDGGDDDIDGMVGPHADESKEDWEVKDEMAYKKAIAESRQNGDMSHSPAETPVGDECVKTSTTTTSMDTTTTTSTTTTGNINVSDQHHDDGHKEQQQQQNKRDELLAGASTAGNQSELDSDGIRRRRGGTAGVGGDDGVVSGRKRNDEAQHMEDIMARHRPVQDELTSKLVDMVGQLKESVTANQALLDKDKRVMDDTEDAVDRNAVGLAQQRKRLGMFTQRESTSWWTMIIAALVIIIVFIAVFLFVFFFRL